LKASEVRRPLKQAPRTFAADGLVITRHEAISIDGEPIPYVQPALLPKPGCAVYMSAYGGFGLAVRPYYSFSAWQAVAGARRHLCSGQHPAAARVRHALA